MDKYGFNYFLSRIDVIEEMAKPMKYWRNNDKMNAKNTEMTTAAKRALGNIAPSTLRHSFGKLVLNNFQKLYKMFKFTEDGVVSNINSIVQHIFRKQKDTSPLAFLKTFDLLSFEDFIRNKYHGGKDYDISMPSGSNATPYGEFLFTIERMLGNRYQLFKAELDKVPDNVLNSLEKAFDNLEIARHGTDEDEFLLGWDELARQLGGKTDKEALDIVFDKLMSDPNTNKFNEDALVNSINADDYINVITGKYLNDRRSRSASARSTDKFGQEAFGSDRLSFFKQFGEDFNQKIAQLVEKQRTHNVSVSRGGSGKLQAEDKLNEQSYLTDIVSSLDSISLGIPEEKLEQTPEKERSLFATREDDKPVVFNPREVNVQISIPRSVLRSTTRKEFDKYVKSYFTNMLDKFVDDNSNMAPYTEEDFGKIIQLFATHAKTPSSKAQLQILQTVYNSLKSASSAIEADRNKKPYPPYETQFVKAIFNTPEELDNFTKWYSAMEKLKKMNKLRTIEILSKNIIKQGEAEIVGRDIPVKPDAQVPQEAPTDEEDNETFRYMTEQVESDRLFRPRGEFKDRGIKKPINYWQWMQNR